MPKPTKRKPKHIVWGFRLLNLQKDPYQSFAWNNQGYQINPADNPKFKTLKLLKTHMKFRSHRELPQDYKLCSINISKDSTGYFVSFGIEFKKKIASSIDGTSFDVFNSVGIDLNAYNFATSQNTTSLMKDISEVKSNHLIDNGATDRRSLKYNSVVKILERKQSRRVLKSKKTKLKLGSNHKKTQRNLNKLHKKISNTKNDLYHKISTAPTNTFDLIAVEDLKTKNMSKSSKGNEIVHGKKV